MIVTTKDLFQQAYGKYAVGVPTFQGNLGLDWETPWVKGLAIGGRVCFPVVFTAGSCSLLKFLV